MPIAESPEALAIAWEQAQADVAARGPDAPDPGAEAEAKATAKHRDESGKFAKAEKVTEDAATAEETEAPAAPKPKTGVAAPAKVASKAGAADEASDAPTSLAELQELAKKHGFVVEDAKVLPRERHAFREERRQARQRLEQERAQFLQQREQERTQFAQQFGPVIQAARALQSRDWDGFAKSIGAAIGEPLDDWNGLNGQVIAQYADPNYKRMQELERWKRQREEDEQRSREEQTQLRAKQEEARAIQEYMNGMSAEMAESSDPFIRSMSDDPNFLHAVWAIQRDHFDGDSTITFEEAVRLKPRNGGSALIEQMRTLYSKLKKSGAFEDQDSDDGDRPAQKVETGTRDAQRPARNRSTTISQKDASEATPPAKLSDDKQFFDYALAELQRAADEENRARRKQKTG